MRNRTLLVVLLGLLLIGATVETGPPPPPGLITSIKTKLLSPKQAEHVKSLGNPMLIAPALVIPSQFAITNIILNSGNFTLSWNSNAPGPYQIWGKPSLTSSWSTQENITILLSQTFPQGENQFWKVQAQIPILFLNTNDQPRLTWAVPEISMSDSLQDFTVQRRTNEPPANQAISDNTGWTTIGTEGASVRSFHDSDPVPASGFWYRLKQTTANGVVVPYPIKSVTNNASGTPLWVRSQGGTGYDITMDTVATSDGGHVAVGVFNGTATFDPGNAVGSILTANGYNNLFIVKYSASGVFQWVKQYDGPNAYQFGSYMCLKVRVLSTGDLIVAGTVQSGQSTSSANFGGSTINSTTSQVGFLAKYDSDGEHIWSFGIVNAFQAKIFGMTIDSQDRINIVGQIRGITVPQTPVKIQQPDGNGPSVVIQSYILIAQFTEDGIFNWMQNTADFDSDAANQAYGVSLDTSDNLYVSGYSVNHNFGGGDRIGSRTFLLKLTSSGTYVFDSLTTTEPPGDEVFCKYTPNGVAVGLKFFINTTVNGQVISVTTGQYQMLVILFSSSNGSYLNHALIPGIGGDSFCGIKAIDANDSGIFITGYSKYGHQFGSFVINSINQSSIFVAKYNYALQCLWAIRCGKTIASYDGDSGQSLCLDPLGNVIATGQFYNLGVFGSLSVQAQGTSGEGYVVKISP